MDIARILVPEFIIVTCFLYGVGAVIKAIPKIPNWIIPITLLLLGCIIGVIYGPFAVSGQSWAYYFMMGGLAGWAAVGANQTVKQIWYKEHDDDSEVDE